MDNYMVKRVLWRLLTVSLALSLFLGCSTSRAPTRVPMTTAGAVAAVLSGTRNTPSTESPHSADDIAATDPQNLLVYITETGSRYHSNACSYLAKSCIPVEMGTAKRSYSPCSKCRPPQ